MAREQFGDQAHCERVRREMLARAVAAIAAAALALEDEWHGPAAAGPCRHREGLLMSVAEVGAVGGGGAVHTLARSQQVARWLVEGCSTAEVHQQAREVWGVSHLTVVRLVAAARAELIRGWDVERHEMIALLLSRLDTVFREAMAAKNHGAALGAINSAAKLAQP